MTENNINKSNVNYYVIYLKIKNDRGNQILDLLN